MKRNEMKKWLFVLLQIPGFLFGACVSNVFGRRKAIIGFFIVSSIGNVFLVLPDDWYYWKLTAGIIGVSCGGAVTHAC